MSLRDVIFMATGYFLPGIILVAILAVVFSIGYFVIYRKILKGNKKPDTKKLCWLVVFICYMIIVFGATLDRAGVWEFEKMMPLFYSYKEAWNAFSMYAWRNIVLNIMMFVPIGFLLPVGIQKCRRFWYTYLTGILLTVMIESIQLVMKRGIFEMDDILNNFVGAMIGYGCYVLLAAVYKLVKKEKPEWKNVAVTQLPLIITISVFGMIFAVYAKQELGNLELAYIVKCDTDRLRVETTESYSTMEKKVPVYQVPVLSEKEATKLAKDFFQRLGTELDRDCIDRYDESIYFRSIDGDLFWVIYAGGAYGMADSDFAPEWDESEEKREQKEESEKTVREALTWYEIAIPDEAKFHYSDEWGYQFAVEGVTDGEFMYDGTLTCKNYQNGRFGDVDYDILQCEKYKEFTIISEQEAYQQICDGKFKAYNGRYSDDELEITLGKVRIGYSVDSKGFYQPVYEFDAVMNGESYMIEIPALK